MLWLIWFWGSWGFTSEFECTLLINVHLSDIFSANIFLTQWFWYGKMQSASFSPSQSFSFCIFSYGSTSLSISFVDSYVRWNSALWFSKLLYVTLIQLIKSVFLAPPFGKTDFTFCIHFMFISDVSIFSSWFVFPCLCQ